MNSRPSADGRASSARVRTTIDPEPLRFDPEPGSADPLAMRAAEILAMVVMTAALVYFAAQTVRAFLAPVGAS